MDFNTIISWWVENVGGFIWGSNPEIGAVISGIIILIFIYFMVGK